jgi:hypothetical protein
MVSLVAVMQSGATVETATIGRGGVIGARRGREWPGFDWRRRRMHTG